jgi:hypothetical protein
MFIELLVYLFLLFSNSESLLPVMNNDLQYLNSFGADLF